MRLILDKINFDFHPFMAMFQMKIKKYYILFQQNACYR